jgi:hypothetical protein
MHSDSTTDNVLETCAFLEIPYQAEMDGDVQPVTIVGWNRYGLFLVDRRGMFDKDSDIKTDEVVNLMLRAYDDQTEEDRKAIDKILKKVEYDFD